MGNIIGKSKNYNLNTTNATQTNNSVNLTNATGANENFEGNLDEQIYEEVNTNNSNTRNSQAQSSTFQNLQTRQEAIPNDYGTVNRDRRLPAISVENSDTETDYEEVDE